MKYKEHHNTMKYREYHNNLIIIILGAPSLITLSAPTLTLITHGAPALITHGAPAPTHSHSWCSCTHTPMVLLHPSINTLMVLLHPHSPHMVPPHQHTQTLRLHSSHTASSAPARCWHHPWPGPHAAVDTILPRP